MSKQELLSYKHHASHDGVHVAYDVMDNTHDVPEMMRDTHGYGATLMRAMSFPTHVSDIQRNTQQATRVYDVNGISCHAMI